VSLAKIALTAWSHEQKLSRGRMSADAAPAVRDRCGLGGGIVVEGHGSGLAGEAFAIRIESAVFKHSGFLQITRYLRCHGEIGVGQRGCCRTDAPARRQLSAGAPTGEHLIAFASE